MKFQKENVYVWIKTDLSIDIFIPSTFALGIFVHEVSERERERQRGGEREREARERERERERERGREGKRG